MDVELGLRRASARDEADRFELEKAAFFMRVREKYKERARISPQRYEVIDASRNVEAVQDDIIRRIETLL